MRHINNPEFGAVIFRRSYPQITAQGGMWDESGKLYPLLGAQPNSSDHFWRFPSGARVQFAHMQHERNMYDWQGAQIPLIGWDELTHFTESQFFYMMSRNRSMSGVQPYMRATCNADAESWVARLIEWWIDQDTGLPIEERAGVVRWFVRTSEGLQWGASRREMREHYPDQQPKSLTFIPAKVHDNRKLLEANPEYLANLLALPLVERERLLGGNWKIKPSAGRIFNRAWFDIVDEAPNPPGSEECRFWDFAATEKKMAKDDPDFTAGVKIRRVGGIYYVMDCIAVQEGPVEVDRQFTNITRQDAQLARAMGVRYRVRWELEGGASGKRDTNRLAQMVAGADCGGVRPQGDKITRAKPLAAQAEAGNVKLLRGAWNEMWLEHMHNQPEWPHDDIMDASAGAFDGVTWLGGQSGETRVIKLKQ